MTHKEVSQKQDQHLMMFGFHNLQTIVFGHKLLFLTVSFI